ncbi:hypothetical protein ACFOET_06165 [Parapedobacter deserti]|uniref:Uncharacterized protein n=1 Tax=Parapedobacter deserti TaxID=1912957 RepID=A0ABV7JK21_9SPHI
MERLLIALAITICPFAVVFGQKEREKGQTSVLRGDKAATLFWVLSDKSKDFTVDSTGNTKPVDTRFSTHPMPNAYRGDNCVSMPNVYLGDDCVPMPNVYGGPAGVPSPSDSIQQRNALKDYWRKKENEKPTVRPPR